MKTPEEIKNFETKKELAYVAFGKVSCEGCHKIAAKALAYIQRLEAQNAELVKKVEQLKADKKKIMETANILSDAVNRLERERDAAVFEPPEEE